jgi:hypothetical protein
VRGIITLFSLVMTAVVEDKMIATNPIQGMRLADRRAHHRVRPAKRRTIPTDQQVLDIAQRVGQLGGSGRLRHGDPRRVHRHAMGRDHRPGPHQLPHRDRRLLIDPDAGSLHEIAGKLWLGPPKSEAAARRIDLPPFLATLLEEILDSHTHDQVFTSPTGRWLRRLNFARRIWRPACDGHHEHRWSPILPGAVFHGLRHLRKTLLDETGLPDVIMHERMGHHMPGIGVIYSHVTDTMRRQLIDELETQWNTKPTN